MLQVACLTESGTSEVIDAPEKPRRYKKYFMHRTISITVLVLLNVDNTEVGMNGYSMLIDVIFFQVFDECIQFCKNLRIF